VDTEILYISCAKSVAGP